MGKAAKGTLLKIGDGAATSEAFTAINEVRDISGGGLGLDTEDLTHQTSPVEEVAPTVVRTEEVTFQVNANPRHATHSTAGLRGDLVDRTERNFELVRPASTSTAGDALSFTGYVTGLSPAYAVTGGLVQDVTLKPHRTVPTWSTRASVS